MRNLTTIVIVGAVMLVIAVGLLMRTEEAAPAPAERRTAERRVRDRPPRQARVEERLQRLRENDETRRKGGQTGGQLNAPARPQVPREDARAMLPTPRPHFEDEDFEDAEDLAELAETIRHDPDPEERASAVFFLGGSDEKIVVPVLIEAMSDTNAEVRVAAVEALGDYVENLEPAVLAPALTDPDAEVRFEALGVIGDMEDEEQVRDIARRMLHDPNDDVRALAEGILDMEG